MEERQSHLDDVLQPVGVQEAYDKSGKSANILMYRPKLFIDFVGLVGRMKSGTEIAVELPVVPGMMPSAGHLSMSLGMKGYEAIVVIPNVSSDSPIAYVERK